MANSKAAQALTAVPFFACVVIDLIFNLTDTAHLWVNWAVVIYAGLLMWFFQKQYEKLGGLMILWTVLGGIIFIILNAYMEWNHLFSLIPMGFIVTHLEMLLFLPRKAPEP